MLIGPSIFKIVNRQLGFTFFLVILLFLGLIRNMIFFPNHLQNMSIVLWIMASITCEIVCLRQLLTNLDVSLSRNNKNVINIKDNYNITKTLIEK